MGARNFDFAQMPRGSALVNPTTEQKLLWNNEPDFPLFCASTPDRFGLKLHDISDVTFSASQKERRVLVMYKQQQNF